MYLYRFLLSLRKNNYINKINKKYTLTNKGNKIFNMLLTL